MTKQSDNAGSSLSQVGGELPASAQLKVTSPDDWLSDLKDMNMPDWFAATTQLAVAGFRRQPNRVDRNMEER